MNALTNVMQWIHKVLGTLLSILFLVWFLSGLVMIYHSFPQVNPYDRLKKMDPLSPEGLPSIESVIARLPEGESIRRITLDSYLGVPCFHIQGKRQLYDLPADSCLIWPETPDFNRIATHWVSAPIARIDTLYELEQWIPFGRLKQEFPIYKYYFDDTEQHQLYISSHSGKVLQRTDAKSRFWAWVGAIPHWIYFTSLRQDAKLWSQVVIWLSGIGCLMCLAGGYLAIRDLRWARRRGKGLTPYKKFWYKWHHLAGLLFGLFVLTFVFSGMMSLANVRDVGITSQLPFKPMERMQQMAPPLAAYQVDYRKVLAAYPGEIRQLTWEAFGPYPIYALAAERMGKGHWVDASAPEVRSLKLTEEQVMGVIEEIHGREQAIHIEWLDHYDTYYLPKKYRAALPVWKVTIDDVDGSTYYIHPYRGTSRYMDRAARWQHWAYPALHSLNFRVLTERPWLWHTVMWILMLGGSFVSLSGVYLALRCLLRWGKQLGTRLPNRS